MKITLTVAIFLGLASSIRLEHHSHHRRQHHHKKHNKLAQYKGNSDAWIDDCDPERDVSAQTNPSGAGTFNGKPDFGSYPGVGVECQGFAQRKSRDQDYSGGTNAWIDDCAPGRNPFIAGNGNAGTGGSYPGVGIECQGFSQKKRSLVQKRSKDQDYAGGTNAWIDDCAPGRNPFIAGNGNAGTGGSYPGVGIECQGFSQKKKQSLAQAKDQDYAGGTNAWIDDCSPDRVMNGDYGSGTQGAPGALPTGSFDKVGIECQGFAQRKSQSLAQAKDQDYEGGTNAWIDDCSPDRVMNGDYGSGTQGAPGATGAGSYTGVGVECQGFAQKKSQSLAQAKDQDYEGGTNAWIDDCDANRDPWALKNPSGAGTYEETNKGSFPGVGVECQGFAQRKSLSLAQAKDQEYAGGTNAWIDDCDPNRDPWALKNPSGAGTYEESQNGSFPGVGVECQGFAQRGAIHSLAQTKDQDYEGGTLAWVDNCDASRNPWAQKNPSGAGTFETGAGGRMPGVGIECQGFAQVKSRSQYKGNNDAWIEDCNPDRDVSAQTSPGGAGTGGSYPGVGVECQGFAQKKSSRKLNHKKHHFLQKHARECPEDMPDCNGTNGTPGVDCCDE